MCRFVGFFRAGRLWKAVGLAEIEVLVRDPEDRSTRRFKSLISNIQRENIRAVELAETLRSLLDAEAVPTQRELARQIGKSEQWMSGILRILDMPSRLQELLRNRATSIGYDTAQRIAQVKDPALQEELIAAALTGETTREIRLRIDGRKTVPAAARRQGKATVVQFTEKVGNCIATVKVKRGKEARGEMIEALRLLEKQVRNDDSIH